jgi:alpha-amylase
MMAITDNKTGDDIRKAVVSHNASSAASSSYKTGQAANKLVLWAESHDTYANDSQESTNVSQSDINKTWALVASRKDATALYFARPGEVGSIGTYDWMSLEVSAVNNFHNSFIGANETLYSQDKFAIVERYDKEKSGMVIVNCNGTNATISINSKNMKDGTYFDQVTGNEFMVASGKVTGNIGSSGIAVLTQESGEKAPVAQLSQEGGYFSNTLNVSIDLSFATSARVKIGTKEQIITKDTSISIGENMKNGESVTVEVSVINDKYRQTKTYEFTKLSGITANSVVVSKVPTSYTSGTNYDIYVWMWTNGSQNGEFVKTTLNGSYVVFEMKSQYDSFLLLTVSKGAQPAWNYKVKQTSDFKFVKGAIYEAPKEAWS